MAIKVVEGHVGAINLLAKDATLFTEGSLVVRDTSNGYLIEATATVADHTILEGIIEKTQTTGTSEEIRVYPLHDRMFVIADCTANTAANQLMKAHLWTDARTVNNTSTHSTDKDATFIALRTVGAAADKKLFGRIVKGGQVQA